ncbi:4Fe-4S binding protein [Desulfovibrio aminophilus]|uniref:4Fe-4S binding protein n=1 Tax=Desulfovibrio aminophilus TaxID=81425 RepID=UPI0033978A8E
MPRVIVNAARCVNARKTVCSRCADICHSHSIRLDGVPSIDRLSCNDCGACAAVCPTDALVAFDSGRFIGRVRRLPKTAPLVLGCKKAAASGPDVVGIGHCFSALGADALMGLVALGFANVVFAHGDCPRCTDGDRLRGFERMLEETANWLSVFGLRNDVCFEKCRIHEAAERRVQVDHSRRNFLSALFSGRREPGGSMSEKSPLSADTAPGKHANLVRQLHRIRRNHPIAPEPGRHPVQIADTCNACGACGAVCPTGALHCSSGENRFRVDYTPSKCLRCTLCVSVCGKKCITFNGDGYFLPLLDGTEVVADFACLKCVRCNSSSKELSKNGLCAICDKKVRIGIRT